MQDVDQYSARMDVVMWLFARLPGLTEKLPSEYKMSEEVFK